MKLFLIILIICLYKVILLLFCFAIVVTLHSVVISSRLSPPNVSHLCWDGLLTGFTGHHGKAAHSVQEPPH